MSTVGQYLVQMLEARGVRHVFGIPGVHNLELYRGLPASGIRHIVGRHEQGLGFMADGYARATGRPGVCFTITGPGVSNIATAMAQAYGDSIPMLVVASLNRRGEFSTGRGFLHELPDQHALAAQVSAFTHTVLDPTEVPAVLARAWSVFDGARPRPVCIEVPLDVLAASAEGLTPPARVASAAAGAACAAALDVAATTLRAAATPLVLAGGGARRAAAELRAVAEHLGAPVVMTINGRGILPPGHPLAVPYSPSLRPVRELIAAADTVLAVGTEFGPTDYDMNAQAEFPSPRNLLRIDIDASQLARSVRADVALLGDARETLAALLRLDLGPRRESGGTDRAAAGARDARAILSDAYREHLILLERMREAIPHATFVGDSTQLVYAGNMGFAASTPGSWFNSATGFGTLGYAVPAATGAGIGDPTRPVVCLIGDGGLQFSLGELGVLRDEAPWVAVVVWNNDGYGEIKTSMLAAGMSATAVDVRPPDLGLLARAYALPYRRVADASALLAALCEFAAQRGPLLIEIDAQAFH